MIVLRELYSSVESRGTGFVQYITKRCQKDYEVFGTTPQLIVHLLSTGVTSPSGMSAR